MFSKLLGLLISVAVVSAQQQPEHLDANPQNWNYVQANPRQGFG